MIAALPMYDWPERRDEVDAEWVAIRDRLRAAGVEAPEALTRETGDLYDFWRRPDLLFAQTCWGPMEDGLAGHVQVIGQQNYDGVEGGQGEFYSSAIVMRAVNLTSSLRGEVAPQGGAGGGGGNFGKVHTTPALRADPPPSGEGAVPLDLLRNKRLAYNVPDSMSGFISLTRDLAAAGESLDIFSAQIQTGGHRKSIRAVADGEADVAAIDCMSWELAKRHERAAVEKLEVVGWTARRKGLPFITARTTPPDVVAALKAALAG